MRSDREGEARLHLYDRSTQKVDRLKNLRTSGDHDRDPVLTPDGRYLSFASDRAGGLGGFDIYVVNLTADPRSFVELPDVNPAGDERHPRFGHSGSHVAVQSQSPGSTGWNVRDFDRTGNLAAQPSRLAGASPDIHPSVRLP